MRGGGVCWLTVGNLKDHRALDLGGRLKHRAARDGVQPVLGGVVFTDNETIFVSKAMNMVAREHNKVMKHSAEYEPWGNGAIEHVFTYVVHEMRKLKARSNLPDDFWDFMIMHAERILNARRVRDGANPRSQA